MAKRLDRIDSAVLRSAAALLVATSLAATMATPVAAATLTVSTTDDEFNVDGDCSLREAIASANTDAQVDACIPAGGFGDDTILLAAGTYDLSTVGTELVINDTTAPANSLVISGAAAATTIIQANAAAATATFRVLSVSAGSLALEDLTVRHGGGTANGGAILFDSTNNSALTLTRCVVTDNRTTGNGGALSLTANPYSLVISDTTFLGNSATGSGATGGAGNILGTAGTTVAVTDSVFEANTARGAGGAFRFGTSIASVAMTRSRFTGNIVDGSGADGGAVSSLGNILEIVDCSFENNQSRDEGGAVRVGSGATSTTIRGSTFRGNRVTSGTGGDGGALRELSSTLTITNSTFVENAANNDGGAIHKGGSGLLVLNNVTIVGNIADDDANNGGSGGGIRRANGNLVIANSIIAGNEDKSATTRHPDCSTGSSAAVVTQGHNLIGVGDLGGCTTFVDGTNGDQVGTDATPLDPALAAIGTFGGSTETRPPLPGSPAIDAGNPDSPLDGALDGGSPALRRCIATDQRGESRPFGPACDTGAVEFVVEPTATPTDTPTALPTDTPTAVPTDTPTAGPTDTPTAVPTDTPTAVPTDTPTAVPTDTPTAVPTDTPTAVPTDTPTELPTETPTAVPTATPSETPAETPTPAATVTSTSAPTETSVPTATTTATPTVLVVDCSAPSSGCRAAGGANKAKLVIQDHHKFNKYDSIVWSWRNGTLSVPELGDPRTTTSYRLCVFDAQGTPIVASEILPSASWSPIGKGTGFKYADRRATQQGAVSLRLDAGKGGRTSLRATLRGKAGNLGNPGGPNSGNLPDLPQFPLESSQLPLRVQLKNDAGFCWESTLTTVKANVNRPLVSRYRATGR